MTVTRLCIDAKQDFSIELLRDGEVFETHAFNGVTRNAKARARKLAHTNNCAYRIKRKRKQ